MEFMQKQHTWNNVKNITEIKITTATLRGNKDKTVIKFVTEDFDLKKLCWRQFNLYFKK